MIEASYWQERAEHLCQRLLDHYGEQGRDLPWRTNLHPYRVWLAEVMLQQTGVATVIPYYEKFLHHFPSVESLAAADIAQVLTLWQGLGYYRRAHNLHRAARMIQEVGIFPQDEAGWRSLPGVGANTAAAIMAIVHGTPTAILDGNVKRVLARLTALASPVKENESLLWQLAGWLTCRQQPGDYAQAIMDLGATLCLPRKPLCGQCPWSDECLALASGNAQQFPVAATKTVKPRLQQQAILIWKEGEGLLLVQRPEQGLLAGLWQPPCGEMHRELPSLDTLVASLAMEITLEGEMPTVSHTFTHFHLTVHPHLARWQSGVPTLPAPWCWCNDPATLPMATLHRKILAGHPSLVRLVKATKKR
ncbi:MAG: A/G-specific adenine glycosylase [Magnetococcales bacterium]|nr:A/G-specific adenine glycosylase [Magnetococcales bacterium]